MAFADCLPRPINNLRSSGRHGAQSTQVSINQSLSVGRRVRADRDIIIHPASGRTLVCFASVMYGTVWYRYHASTTLFGIMESLATMIVDVDRFVIIE
jgi:hypothetical protein